MRHITGYLPEEALELKDAASRWFVIGKDRFEREINLGRVLKTLRNVKKLTLAEKEKKA